MPGHRWWDDEFEGRRHEPLARYVRHIEEEQYDIFNGFFQDAWLYQQCRIAGAEGEWYEEGSSGAVTTNLAESLVDSLVAMVARHMVRLTFQTDGADWSVQRQARRLERFMEADFARMRVNEKRIEQFRDGAVMGTGVLAVSKQDGAPCVERALIDEFVVDENACRYGCAPWLQRRRLVDAHALAA